MARQCALSKMLSVLTDVGGCFSQTHVALLCLFAESLPNAGPIKQNKLYGIRRRKWRRATPQWHNTHGSHMLGVGESSYLGAF